MKITLRQIATLAGVSRGTVDRVLHNRTGVKTEVRSHVLRIIEEAGFVPNITAKALAHHKNPAMIGIILPPKEILFFEQIIAGLKKAEEKLSDRGIVLEIRHSSNREPFEVAEILSKLIEDGAKGILISAMDHLLVREAIDKAVAQNVQVVTFNSDVTQCKRLCFVGQDLYKSGQIAAGLFRKVLQTKANVLVVTGNMSYQAHHARVKGFIEHNKETGNWLSIIDVIEAYDNYRDTYDKLFRALTEHNEIQGIYMATGDIAACVDVLKALGENQRRIHIICNDLMPVVVDNMKSGLIDFTIVQNPFMQGYQSLNILYDYMFLNKKPEHSLIYTDTVIKIFENL